MPNALNRRTTFDYKENWGNVLLSMTKMTAEDELVTDNRPALLCLFVSKIFLSNREGLTMDCHVSTFGR